MFGAIAIFAKANDSANDKEQSQGCAKTCQQELVTREVLLRWREPATESEESHQQHK